MSESGPLRDCRANWTNRRLARRPGLRRLLLTAITTLTTLAAVTNASGLQRPVTAAPQALVLRGVTVIDVQDGHRLHAQTVLIVRNRVRRVGPEGSVAAPAGARVINARGKYLIPGLWDMHVHPFGEVDVFYPLFVADGVTGVRDPGSDQSLVTLNRWKEEIAAGARVGPRLFVAGPSIQECPFPNDIRHQICVSTASEARLVVDFLKLAGADFIKPYSVSKELYLAMLAEARRIGIPFGGHTQSLDGLEASDSGARFLDHDSGLMNLSCGEQAPTLTQKCADAFARLRRNNTWVVATPGDEWAYVFAEAHTADVRRYYADSAANMFNTIVRKGRAGNLGPDRLFRHLPRVPSSFADFTDAVQRVPSLRKQLPNYTASRGMPVVAGTDVARMFFGIPGHDLHEVLVTFVLGGMTPLEALQTATLNPAKAIGAFDSLGTVAEGKLADLVLLDADPLLDIWNTTKIRAVVANGRYFDHAALDGLRAQAERALHRR